MRISYSLISQFALLDDTQAMNVMTEWEKQGPPHSDTNKVQAYFNQEVGFFLYSPNTSIVLGMTEPRPRSKVDTLVGVQALTFDSPDVIITDNDGDSDDDE